VEGRCESPRVDSRIYTSPAVRGVGYLAHSSALKSNTHAALLERPLAVDEARASGDSGQASR
jgi:hypothetical protein